MDEPATYERLFLRVENACLGPPATLRALEGEVALADLDDLQRLDLVSRIAEIPGIGGAVARLANGDWAVGTAS